MKMKFINLLLICSVFVSLFAAPEYTASAKTISNISQKTELLQSIINLPGEAATGTSSVKRKAYADALAKLLGQGFDVSQSVVKTKFYDVFGKDSATQSIAYLEQKGIIQGDSNGFFRPDEDIVFDDALRMMMYALGYAKLTDNDNLFNLASNTGILKGVPYRSGEFLTGEQLVGIFYNALSANIVKIDRFDGSNPVYSSKDETLLTGILNMYKTKGVIEQTPYTSLYKQEGCAKGTVTVGNYNYICDDISIIDYIGYTVEIYCKAETDGDRILYWIIDDNNDNIEIDAEDIESFSDYTIEYTKEDSSKAYRVKLDKAVRVIYNGKLVDGFNDEMVLSGLGSVKLIKSEGGNYDVMVIEQFKNYRVSGIDKQNETIYSFDTTDVLDLSDSTIDCFLMNEKGIDIELDDISANQIMSVAKSLDGQYIKIIASSMTVSGEVSNIRSGDGKRYITIDGEEYAVASGADFTMPRINQGIKAFLDYKKRIYGYVQNTGKDSWETGYVTKIYRDDTEDAYYAKILQSDNLIVSSPFALRVKVNGETYSNNALEVCEDLFNGDAPKRQLVRYKTNAEGKIIKVETVKENGSEKSQLRATERSTQIYRSGASTFGYKTFIGNNTMVFVVPEDSTNITGGTKGNAYISDINLFSDLGEYSIKAYTVGDDMTEAHAVVVTRDSTKASQSMTDWAWTYVIKEIYQQVDEDNEIITKVKLQRLSSETEFTVTQAALDNVWAGGSYTGAYELGEGDAVRIARNSSGEINLIELLYDADKQKYTAPRSQYINSSFTASVSYAYGMAAKRAKDSEERIYVDYGFEGNREYLVIIPVNRFQTTMVDLSGKKISVHGGEVTGEVKTRDVFGTDKASRMIISTERGMPREIIIYNY